MRNRGVWVIAGILLLTAGVRGHHSISGAYDTGRQITIEGTVTEFLFVNPHPFVTIEVKPAGSAAQSWRLEMDNRFELVQIGMTAQSLKPGDRVIVTGSPGRAGAQNLYVNRLDRPADGFRYEQIGTTPRIRTVR